MAGGRTDDRSQVEASDECENHRSLKRERGGWGSARSCCCRLSRCDLGPLRSKALLATHLAELQPLARASGFYDSSSFFPVRSGAAGGGAKLKLHLDFALAKVTIR